jgi:hypothetical protein
MGNLRVLVICQTALFADIAYYILSPKACCRVAITCNAVCANVNMVALLEFTIVEHRTVI